MFSRWRTATSIKREEALQNLRPSSLECLISLGIFNVLPSITIAQNMEPTTPTCPGGGSSCSSPAWMTQNINSCNNKAFGSEAEPWRAVSGMIQSRGRALKCSWGQHLSHLLYFYPTLSYLLNNNMNPQPFSPSPKPINTLGIIHAARTKSAHHRSNTIPRYTRHNIQSRTLNILVLM